jgi:hypothetical protein
MLRPFTVPPGSDADAADQKTGRVLGSADANPAIPMPLNVPPPPTPIPPMARPDTLPPPPTPIPPMLMPVSVAATADADAADLNSAQRTARADADSPNGKPGDAAVPEPTPIATDHDAAHLTAGADADPTDPQAFDASGRSTAKHADHRPLHFARTSRGKTERETVHSSAEDAVRRLVRRPDRGVDAVDLDEIAISEVQSNAGGRAACRRSRGRCRAR